MSTTTQLLPHLVEPAMIALVRSDIATLYGEAVDVGSIGAKDFNDAGELVLTTPSVRIRYERTEVMSAGRDTTKCTYNVGLHFQVWCYAEDLRSREAERRACLQLADAVCKCLVGARMQIVDGEDADAKRTDPVEWEGNLPMMQEGVVIDQFYSVLLRVPGFVQFPGTNSNWGQP